MRKVSRSALVAYSAGEMFDLVSDVESYPVFLPWCSGARVYSREDRAGLIIIDGAVEMRRAGLRRWFRTENTLLRPESIEMHLVDGPFESLSGGWRFKHLGDLGSKVSLELEFEFDSRVANRLIGPFFVEICNTLVDAFTRRAEQVYGLRGPGDG